MSGGPTRRNDQRSEAGWPDRELLAGPPMFGLRPHDLGHIRIRSDFNGPFSESLRLSHIGARFGGDPQAVCAIALAKRADTFLFGLCVPQ